CSRSDCIILRMYGVALMASACVHRRITLTPSSARDLRLMAASPVPEERLVSSGIIFEEEEGGKGSGAQAKANLARQIGRQIRRSTGLPLRRTERARHYDVSLEDRQGLRYQHLRPLDDAVAALVDSVHERRRCGGPGLGPGADSGAVWLRRPARIGPRSGCA